jgi:hypothetical protein
MKKSSLIKLVFIFVILLSGLSGCNQSEPVDSESSQISNDEVVSEPVDESNTETNSQDNSGDVPAVHSSSTITIEKTELIEPSDLVYQGAFRLPDEYVTIWDEQVSFWSYSGRSMAYYSNGDPSGEADGFPGSLFAGGHDLSQFVSEISIPAPVISRNIADLPVAKTLQKPADITGGMFGELEIPTQGLAILPGKNGEENSRLYFCWGQHFQGTEPSHGSCELDLSDPNPVGPWYFGNYTNYVTNDYLFEIPKSWADKYAPGMTLASGRFREGVWGGFGPALFAFSPEVNGKLPAAGYRLKNITPLLLYGTQEEGGIEITTTENTRMNIYSEPDVWSGGAWLTDDDRAAVIFSGTKAVGKYWYGFANGVVWDYECAEHDPPDCPDVPEWPYSERGYWAEDVESMILFFNPSDLAAVATGQMESWEPQPYATWSIDEYLYDQPGYNYERGKRQMLGSCAFDNDNGILYVFERMVADDEEKSIVHVWKIN